jgi:hypothetical protein
MHLLGAADWRHALAAVGFVEITQDRLRVPHDQASEPWKAAEGSLVTFGVRP